MRTREICTATFVSCFYIKYVCTIAPSKAKILMLITSSNCKYIYFKLIDIYIYEVLSTCILNFLKKSIHLHIQSHIVVKEIKILFNHAIFFNILKEKLRTHSTRSYLLPTTYLSIQSLCIFLSPLPCHFIMFFPIFDVHLCNSCVQRIVRVWIC